MNNNNKKFPSFGEWSIQKEKENGMLVFLDKGGKFLETQHSLAILTHNCDIKIDSQVVDGEYRWLLIEVSPKGSLDTETFERDPNAPVVCLKTEYESTHPNTLFSTAKNSGRLMGANLELGQFKTYIAEKGLKSRNITEEEYNDPNYVF